ncbi:rod shape-determining protein MreC [Chitinophaga costaii]|uniref:Cell shape-determining protein MreC n=1 Tax=Chitinophaga costaii TaxID=1335309 RepID=A0A1C4DPQ3_9BACT|nr:rod shape-determining protein MreC [Chitinophaga costaii]PUZ27728.1 rod shape-determining protein MreC [Chitinophaga costaii]SCC33307.1 rod shape-determining protein MreC [Chitinophaga costaii]
MRNLIIFFRRYFNFFLFLLLEVICIVLVFQKNDFQHTAYINSANQISGKMYEQYNQVEYYLHLTATNDSLVRENSRLRNYLATTFDQFDTASGTHTDTLRRFSDDSLHKLLESKVRKYFYREAKVVNNSVNQDVNYITIHRGRLQGVKPNMGVISSAGVVGVVRSASDNYAVVLSLLSRVRNFGFSARLLRTKEMGNVQWDGGSGMYAVLHDIPRNAKVQKGDTVVTSGFSSFFPPDIPIGYVDSVTVEDKSSTSFNIRLKLATNFYNVEYVYVIENLLKDEQSNLEDSTRANK